MLKTKVAGTNAASVRAPAASPLSSFARARPTYARLRKVLADAPAAVAAVMASLKRDNGVVALDYDLFAMARDNLEDAERLRHVPRDAVLHLLVERLLVEVALVGRVARGRRRSEVRARALTVRGHVAAALAGDAGTA